MQANTDECIGLSPGEAYCYCWRTHKIKQVIILLGIPLCHCWVEYYECGSYCH